MKNQTITRSLRWNFTDSELNKMGQDLASSLDEKKQLEAQLKSAKKSYESKIGMEEEAISSLTSKINLKHENRDVKCDVILHHPVDGKKTITRLDTNESWEEPMESRDYDLFARMSEKDEEDLDQGQGEIDFDNAAAEFAGEAAEGNGAVTDSEGAADNGTVTDETSSAIDPVVEAFSDDSKPKKSKKANLF